MLAGPFYSILYVVNERYVVHPAKTRSLFHGLHCTALPHWTIILLLVRNRIEADMIWALTETTNWIRAIIASEIFFGCIFYWLKLTLILHVSLADWTLIYQFTVLGIKTSVQYMHRFIHIEVIKLILSYLGETLYLSYICCKFVHSFLVIGLTE